MRVRNLILTFMLVLGLVVAAFPASAALLGIQIVVQHNTGAGFFTVGTALGGAAGSSTPLDVLAFPPTTLRFIVQFDDPGAAVNGYGTSIVASDPTEIDFVNGSAVELSGAGFASLGANPNNSLNDGSPATGNAARGGSATFASQNMYRVDYLVIGNGFDLREFTVNLTLVGSGNTLNTAAREASVRVVSSVAISPEPSTLFLFGTGLAGLAIFGRRKLRK
jgi:hypothetical protein